MSRLLNEEEVLGKLNIVDWRHLTKDKVIDMASLLDKMDPEVAKKAIEQFPNFANTIKEIAMEYKSVLNKGLESNDLSMLYTCEAYRVLLDGLREQLNRGNLSFDEKKYIIKEVKEIAEKIDKKDTENKKFIIDKDRLLIRGGIILTFALGTVLGVRNCIKFSN